MALSEKKAVKLIIEINNVETEITKKANSGTGRIPKNLLNREKNVICRLYFALTGKKIHKSKLISTKIPTGSSNIFEADP